MMKNKKMRFLSLLICIVLSLNIATFINVSAETEMYADNELSSVVKSIGINMKISEAEQKVTYIDFLMTALDVVKFPVESTSTSEIIDYLIDNKYVYSADVFRTKPTDYITLGEAVYAIVRMLGFEYEAEFSGAYPGGYYNVGVQCDLIDGLTDKLMTDTLNGRDAIRIIYNMLLAPYKSHYDHTQTSSKYNSVLEELYDVYSFEGKVTATEISGMYSTSGAVGEGRIAIDSVTYNIEGLHTNDFLGYAVEGFYIDDGSYKRIIAIEKNERDNDEIIIEPENISDDTNDSQIVYYDKNNKVKTVDLSDDVSVILNCEAYPEYDKSTFKIDSGEIRLVKGGDSEYTTVHICSYESMWVQYFNIDECTVYSFYGGKLDLTDATDEHKLVITDMHGNNKYGVDIRANQVLWIAKSPESGYVKIIISSDSVTGTIESVSTQGNSRYISVNDTEYKVASAYEKSTSRYKISLDVNTNGTFYLDPAGEVFGVKKNTGDGVIAGYVMNVAETGGLSKTVMLKMMNEYGDIIICECAETLKVDGKSQKAAKVIEKLQDVNDEFSVSDIKRQLVLYKLNSKGQVSFIDFAYKDVPETGEGKDSLRVIFNYSIDNSGNSLFYRKSTQSFGGIVAYASSAIQMQVSPKNSEGNDKDYFVKNGLFEDQKVYTIEAYSIGERLVPEFLISYPSGAVVSGEAEYFIYENSSKIYDAETETVLDNINGWFMALETSGGVTAGSKSYKLSEDFAMPIGIDEGDLLKLSLNWKKEVVACEVIYDLSEKKYKYESNGYKQSSGWDAQKNMVLISPIWEDSGYFKCAIGPEPTDESIGTYTVKPDAFNGILVYDSSKTRNPISLGSTSDIPTYESEPTTDCTIIYTSNWGDARGFVVYK